MGRLQQGLGLLGEPQVVAVLPARDKPLPRLAHAEHPPAADDAMPGQVNAGAADHTVATLVVPADHVTPQGQHARMSVRQTETQRACVCVCVYQCTSQGCQRRQSQSGSRRKRCRRGTARSCRTASRTLQDPYRGHDVSQYIHTHAHIGTQRRMNTAYTGRLGCRR
jgi:hypothetical protein